MWALCLFLAYFYLSDSLYHVGRWFGPIVGLITCILSSIILLILIILFAFRKSKRALNAQFIKLSLIPLLGLIPFFVLISIPNKLENQIAKIKVTYITYGCECANWRIKTIKGEASKMNKGEDIFIEASDPKNEIPELAYQNGKTIELIGKFYKQKGFPKDYQQSEQPVEKARIFRYSTFKIIN